MKFKATQLLAILLIASAASLQIACAKKTVAAVPPSPPPQPAAPTAEVALSRSVLEQGESTRLTWKTANATQIAIDGLGSVPAEGSRTLTPSDSMTYHLTASGPGGTAEASARVTVNAKAVAQAPDAGLDELFVRNVRDFFFEYDQYNVRPTDDQIAQSDANFLLSHPNAKVLIEGHCDERGSEDYNMALGDNRANTIRALLQKYGVTADRVRTISYGKEKPFCTQDGEQCWQQNRRAHLVLDR